ncbi:MAG: lipopolysaccharide biosynthesis protein [Deltaproteobacteria bacterium]|nr:lipopolysaccharide biosynthesis protein [Deltaproteobacteria bacterium]
MGALSLGSVITLFAQWLIVPVAMHGWGAKRYGEWTALIALVGTLNLMDLGLQNFVSNRLCAAYARLDHSEFLEALHSSILVVAPLVAITMIIIGVSVCLVPLGPLLKFKTIGGRQLAAVVVMLSIEPLMGVATGIIGGIYRATGQLARGAMIANSRSMTLLCLTLALIAHHYSFMSVAIARASAASAVAGFVLWDVRRSNSWVRLWPMHGTWRGGFGMIGPSTYFLLLPVANYLGNEVIIFLIQRVLGGVEVGRYSTHRTALGVARMASTLVAVALWPEMTMIHARRQYQQLERLHRIFARTNFWLVACIVALTIAALPMFYGIWTARRLTLDPWTLGILSLRAIFWGSWSSSMTLLLSINRQRSVAISLLASASIAGLLGYYLIPAWGISGAACALLVGDLCAPAWVLPAIASQEMRSDLSTFLLHRFALPMLALAVPAGSAMAAWSVINSQLARYFVIIPLVAIFALVSIWRQLEPLERRLVKEWFDQAASGARVLFSL